MRAHTTSRGEVRSMRGLEMAVAAPHMDPATMEAAAAAISAMGPGASKAARVLASRPDLAGAARTVLASSSDRDVRRSIVPGSTDRNLVVQAVRSSDPSMRASAARNPAADADMLAELLKDEEREVRLRAACNPSTPEDERKGALGTPRKVSRLIPSSTQPDLRAAQAGALALANPWMCLSSEGMPDPVLRALASIPGCPVEVLESQRGRWAAADLHPTMHGLDIASMTLEELSTSAAAASHVEMLGREGMTVQHAGAALREKKVLLQDGALLPQALHSSAPASMRAQPGVVRPEAHVLGAVLGKVGSGALLHAGDVPVMSRERIESVAWVDAYAGHLLGMLSGSDPSQKIEDAQRASTILGSEASSWTVFARLVEGSSDLKLVAELAEAAAA